MRSRFLSLVLLVILVTALPCRGDIVNTLRISSSEEPGWSGGLSGSYSAEGGNTEETNLKFSGLLQWRQGNELVRLLGNGKRTSTSGAESARAFMVHLRHNHRLSPRWSTLTFFQSQINPFQRLKSRRLFGLGGRFDLACEKTFSLALGAAHMWEREEISDTPGAKSLRRLSTFVSTTLQIKPGVEVDGLAFYQPRYDDFADFRSFAKVDLAIDLTGFLVLFTGVQVEHDARPPAGVEKTDWQTSTGFSVTF